ncbi:copper resistance CopC family protein [Methylobacter sp. S3L5C]|uniref:copper resistance CopC family protein n=1 Tax=Methylobacter sp. S3L5C TaxID=2839024 RepID=UPI001FAB5FDB|nr:copper resistance CopC family protein [Methylobacter sp. S3L5C]UOA07213.1 copper resistance protein CopC [Methylobacter sp. S3L5C]
MKKWIKLILLLLVFGQVTLVIAHAVVTDYSLKVTPIHANQPGKVELTFNSKIELGLSQIFLVRKGDKHELLQTETGSKQGQIIIHIPALEPGDYAIRFKIFAADGHLTEDVIHFSVS